MLNHYSREQRDRICLCCRWGNLQWLVKELYRGRNLKAHFSSVSQKSSSSRYIVLHCVTIYCIAEHAVISYCAVISDKMTNGISQIQILLQDFDVGQTYKKKVILTNVSYTTNYCKLLGVTMELMDFISIR